MLAIRPARICLTCLTLTSKQKSPLGRIGVNTKGVVSLRELKNTSLAKNTASDASTFIHWTAGFSGTGKGIPHSIDEGFDTGETSFSSGGYPLPTYTRAFIVLPSIYLCQYLNMSLLSNFVCVCLNFNAYI